MIAKKHTSLMKALLPSCTGILLLLACDTSTTHPSGAEAADGVVISSFAYLEDMDEQALGQARQWISSMLHGVSDGSMEALDIRGGRSEVIPVDIVARILNRVDTIITLDTETGELVMMVQEVDHGVDAITAIAIRERWAGVPPGDRSRTIEHFAPCVTLRAEDGTPLATRPLFWVKADTGNTGP
jgi:hypothetical protein